MRLSDDTPSRIIDSFDTRSLQRGIQEYSDDESGDHSRDEIYALLQQEKDSEELKQALKHGTRLRTADSISSKLKHIEKLRTPKANAAAQRLTNSELSYYNSFFSYTNHTTRVHKVPSWDGVLSEISEEASTASEAEAIFWERFEEGEIPEEIAIAAESLPAPLIGNLKSGVRPRVLFFEDANHIYVEYWSRGDVLQGFDIDSGQHETISTPYRCYIRLHLDSRLVEAGGDRNTPHHDEIKHLMTSLSGNPINSDIEIRANDIQTVKEDLSLVVTLDEFAGEDAKLRFARNEQDGNVQADPIHAETQESRPQIRSNFQIFLGKTSQGWELINPSSITERYTEGDTIKLASIREDLERSEAYSEVMNLTVGLNNEKSTIRIMKSALTPRTRREIFHIFADRIGWRDT